MLHRSLLTMVAALTALGADRAAAQSPALAAAADTAPARVAANPGRASWLSDQRPLRVGDILTIVVDEQTVARERTSVNASARRGQKAELGAGIPGGALIGPNKGFSTGMDNSSRESGEANRQGDLVAVLSVRVTALEPGGIARVEGAKAVTVDGRTQEVRLKGLVRAEDVTAANLVASSRVAEAVISYQGKKIGPRQGILGKILSILWP